MENNIKKKNIFGGLLLVLVVSLLTVGAGCAKQDIDNQTGTEYNNTSPLTVNWKTYIDPTIGFTFKYPSNATSNDTKGVEGLVFGVMVNNLDTMEDIPSGFDRANILRDKNALSNGDPSTPFSWAVSESYKILSIKNALAKELTFLQQFEMCDVQFNRQAIIYKDNYQIILSWMYAGKDIQNNNPSYFKTDSVNCGSEMIWKDGKGFYTDLVAGKTDSISQNWFIDFDEIIKTMQFTNIGKIAYEKYIAGETGVSFDVPTTGSEVQDNPNGFPNSWKFTYNNDSYVIKFNEFRGGQAIYTAWEEITDHKVIITEKTHSKVYTDDILAHSESFFFLNAILM